MDNDLVLFIGMLMGILSARLGSQIHDVIIIGKHGKCEKCGLPNYQSIL